MEFFRPATLDEALAAKAEHPDATPLAGGTDVLVELNFDRRRPPALLDLSRVAELADWSRDGDVVRVGAGVTYRRVIRELSRALPGLALAARTVGSPQIRNRGTVGGNLGSASPAGDAHPPLLASGAAVEVASTRGSRHVPLTEFFTGPKRHALAPDELITAFRVAPADGPQQFAKIGSRNAMVIAVCSFAIALRPDAGAASGAAGGVGAPGGVGAAIGSAAPTPRRAQAAERFLAGELGAAGQWASPRPLPESVIRRFGELVAAAAAPIDDVRGAADYRRHALSVLARRTLSWAWQEHCEGMGGGAACA